MTHNPVLIKEVLEYLNPGQNENFIDCTAGEGGHSAEILFRNGPDGKVLAIDLDPRQAENARLNLKRFGKRAIIVDDSYANLKDIAEKENFGHVHGILLDLGMSSFQIEEGGRGFSFNRDEPLDMRYNIKSDLTAVKIVNEYSLGEIEKILAYYGEEKFAHRIAAKICEERKIKKIESAFDLKNIVEKARGRARGERISPATKTFQALRIAVNGELDNLKKVLPQAVDILEVGGHFAVISFHSLEDRIVKNFFKEKEKEEKIKILTKKPVVAGRYELSENPRARSAKLRATVKI